MGGLSPLVLFKERQMGKKTAKITLNKDTSIIDTAKSLAGAADDMFKKASGEKCPSCLGKEYSISSDPQNKRYCRKCNHVWLPQTKDQQDVLGMKADLGKYQDRNKKLTRELDTLKAENLKLRKALNLDPTASLADLE